MKRFPLLVLPLLGLIGCGDTVPVPDEFDAAFATGRVCVPSGVGTGAATFPVRYEFCLYRCVDLAPGTTFVRIFYTAPPAAGLPGQMVMLAMSHLTKDGVEDAAGGCDARNLENPAAGECTPTTFNFDTVTMPNFSGTPVSGDFVVTIPYLTYEEGQRVVKRVQAGEPLNVVLQEEIGPQNIPSRQFVVNFADTHTPVATASEIAAADCHDIPLP